MRNLYNQLISISEAYTNDLQRAETQSEIMAANDAYYHNLVNWNEQYKNYVIELAKNIQ